MPIDIALSTNSPTATLELHQAQHLADHQHYAAFLIVRSGAFAAALPFVFTRDMLHQFEQDVIRLCNVRMADASLRAHDDTGTVTFIAASAARLRIEGELREADTEQRLAFAFDAEWTGMPQFVEGVQALLRSN